MVATSRTLGPFKDAEPVSSISKHGGDHVFAPWDACPHLALLKSYCKQSRMNVEYRTVGISRRVFGYPCYSYSTRTLLIRVAGTSTRTVYPARVGYCTSTVFKDYYLPVREYSTSTVLVQYGTNTTYSEGLSRVFTRVLCPFNLYPILVVPYVGIMLHTLG